MKKLLKKRGKIVATAKKKISSLSLIMVIVMFVLLLVLSYLISSYTTASNCITSKIQLSPGYTSNTALISLSFIVFAVLGLGGWIYASKQEH